MEAAKLTLRLDKAVIERGKVFAKEQGTSLSKMFELYLKEVAPAPENRELNIDSDILAMVMNVNDPTISDGSNAQYRNEYYDSVANKHLREEE